VLAAFAGLLMPSARRQQRQTADEIDHAEMAVVAGGTVLGDEGE
jgi:fructose-specific component phosphotransferase system IIB-like protein